MASIISAGTTDSTSLNVSGDKTGILQLASNNAVTAVTIDASQNVGIGTTSPNSLLTVQNGNILLRSAVTTGALSSYNLGFSATATGGAAAYVTSYRENANEASSLVFGNWNGSSSGERMRIDSSGNVGVGTTSTSAKLSVSVGGVSTLGQQSNQALALLGGGSNNQLCQIGMGYGTGATYTPTAIGSITTTQTGYTIADLIFATRSVNTDTAPTERMRIDSSGNVGIGASPQFKLDVQSTLDGPVVRVYNGRDTAGSIGIKVTLGVSGGAGTTGSAHFHGNTNGVGNWYLYGNGTTSYSSDQRLKKNIETTRDGYLEDLARLRVVKYNWKNDADGTPKELGLIAQEVEQVFAGLVQDDISQISDEDTTIYKQLKGSVLPFMLLKAIQELKAINDTQAETINALTARIVALESKGTV